MVVEPTIEERALPRGPHQLSREEVEESQRDRLLWAITEAVAEKGYIATTVTDVISRAKVSRTTFYQLFHDKLDCFLAANRVASGILVDFLGQHIKNIDEQKGLTTQERFELLLSSYLDSVTELSEFSRVYLVEVYAAGAEAVALRQELLGNFVSLVTASGWGVDDGHFTLKELEALALVMVSALSLHATNALAVNELESTETIKEAALLTIDMLLNRKS